MSLLINYFIRYFDMSSLELSFAGLVKNNNGLFKSEKQASFLLDNCDNQHGKNSYMGEFKSLYGNQVFTVYHCDDRGILKTEKHSRKKGISVTWERKVKGAMSKEEKKLIAKCKREINKYKKSIAKREEAKPDYGNDLSLFHNANEYDKKQIESWQDHLDETMRNI